MKILCCDTATPAVTAGLVELDEAGRCVLGPVRQTINVKAHHEVLTPHIVDCLAEAGLQPTDLDAVVVGEGPGPYTGLRVGMATAAAFATALGIPVYGVSTLDAIAAQAAASGEEMDLVVVTDARRREVYAGRYTVAAGTAQCVGELTVQRPSALDLGGATHLAGAVELLGEVAADYQVVDCVSPSPWGLATAAQPAFAGPPAPLVARYLRRPDAVEPPPPTVSTALRRAEETTS